MENLGPIIRDIRKQLGLTQEDFAGLLGLTVSTINRWEQDHSRPSKLARRTLTRVAGGRGLHVPDVISNPERIVCTPDTPWFPPTAEHGTNGLPPSFVP
jgi:transcriptional regulator with XRE-family HTH domain